MSYVTQADLETRFGADEIIRLADRNGDNVADPAVVAAAISDADAIVDTYLSGRYALPLSPAPAIITRLACVIARYHLYGDKPSDHVEREYKAALETLAKIANGEISLGMAGVDDVGESSMPDYSSGANQFSDLTGH